MTVAINRVTKAEIQELISASEDVKLNAAEQANFDACLFLTSSLYVGLIDGRLVCIWGLIPPTLLSDQAYLWLHTTDAVHTHEFLFVRKSQLALNMVLNEFKTIVGVVLVGNTRSHRWLKWLGAEFGEPNGKLIPFSIRKK